MQLAFVLLCRCKDSRIVILGTAVACIDELFTAALSLLGNGLVLLELVAAGFQLFLGLVKLGSLIGERLLLGIELFLPAAYLLLKLADLLFACIELRFCTVKLRLTLLELRLCAVELSLGFFGLIELLFCGAQLLFALSSCDFISLSESSVTI